MLTRFEVKGFKNFKDNFVLDFTKTNNYNFNKECVKDGIVNKAIIYGPNGVGKSNLGFAIFNIVAHLTDKEKNQSLYSHFLNAENKNGYAEFSYSFIFDGIPLTYKYTKRSLEELVFEELKINEKTVVLFDRTKNEEATIKLKGTKTLKKDLGQEKISVIKYIASNSVLSDNTENTTFKKFYNFIDKMLFFRSLDQNNYIGYENGNNSIASEIINRGNLKNFENFLNKVGIKCNLEEIEDGGKKAIAFNIGGKLIEFYSIASSGTKALALFYCWYQRFKNKDEVSFIFIDEFDAFYHHELSEIIVEEIKKIEGQTILTTHNTSIMSNDLLRPDCYLIMSEKDIKPVTELTNKDLRLAHNLEKMYKAGAFSG